MNHIQTGELGEEAAAAHLASAGYRILVRRYRTRTGEIDIIAQYKQMIVFVEVKTRKSSLFGRPSEAVTLSKQRKIIATALCYLRENRKLEVVCRFDVIEVFLSRQGECSLNHITDAFGR